MRDGTRRILADAKAEISNGWTQGNLVNRPKGSKEPLPDDAPVCLFGALIRSSGLQPTRAVCVPGGVEGRTGKVGNIGYNYNLDNNPDLWEAVNLLADEIGVPFGKVAVWNDSPERTQGEVVALIDEVLAKDPVAIEEPEAVTV